MRLCVCARLRCTEQRCISADCGTAVCVRRRGVCGLSVVSLLVNRTFQIPGNNKVINWYLSASVRK